jgi:hypothetical protein
MVLINLKTTLGSGATDDNNNSNDEFLYETKLSTKVDDLIESLVNIHNARVRSHFIITTVKELATYGVARRIDDGGGGEDDDQKVRAASLSSTYIHGLPNDVNNISNRLIYTLSLNTNGQPHSRLEIRRLIHLGYEWVLHQTPTWLKC